MYKRTVTKTNWIKPYLRMEKFCQFVLLAVNLVDVKISESQGWIKLFAV